MNVNVFVYMDVCKCTKLDDMTASFISPSLFSGAIFRPLGLDTFAQMSEELVDHLGTRVSTHSPSCPCHQNESVGVAHFRGILYHTSNDVIPS